MRIIFLLMFGLMISSGCQREMTQQDYLDEIESAEQELQESRLDEEAYQKRSLEAGLAYKNYIEQFPEDSVRNPKFYHYATQYYYQAAEYDTALVLIERMRNNYPQSEYAPGLLHFKAFYIYESGKKDLEKAKEIYLQFIEKYPQHELVPAVLFSLENLGKTDEEMLDWVRKQDSLHQNEIQ